MNTKNNKRKRDSIQKIEQVLIEFLQTKELNQISVSDICKKANLNRSTFYANYVDIYELADTIRENQIFYRTYFKLGYDEKFKIFRYDYELAKKHFDDKFIDYHMEFFKSGLTKIIKLWLQNDCKETPQEMFEIIKSEYRGREEFFSTK